MVSWFVGWFVGWMVGPLVVWLVCLVSLFVVVSGGGVNHLLY